MKILVLGGAGYIGSHMAKTLMRAGHDVVVLDNLSTGFRRLARYGEFVPGDLADKQVLESIFQRHRIDAVMHFAAASLVGESVADPGKYYRNNVAATLTLLDTMCRFGVTKLVFSSTAAVYGEPMSVPIDEAHSKRPINPYGASKWMVEQILQDYASAYGLSSIRLRYFNAAGADPEGELGECHDPESHLIPLVLQAASGRRDSIHVFGTDYPTADGTCVRDYIHVSDLCAAHLRSLELLHTQGVTQSQAQSLAFNLGIGHGFSVQQVITAAQQVVAVDGYTIKVDHSERRAGDPAVLVANANYAEQMLGWKAQYTNLTDIIAHAWEWEKQQVLRHESVRLGNNKDE